MSRLRELARRAVPRGGRDAVRRLKKTLQGPALFEAELGDYVFETDPAPAPRLTLVLPSLSRRAAFGGVTTGLDIFARLAARLQAQGPLDLRLATTDPDPIETDNAWTRAALAAGLDPAAATLLPRLRPGARLPLRAREVCVAFNWAGASNLRVPLRAQADRFGGPPRPLVYLVQEYEPGFFPFSADHLLMREAYAQDWPIHAVINSEELAAWLSALGHDFARTHVFAPRLTEALRPFLAQVPTAERRRRILVYGRPMENRNCFPLLRRGLELWAERHPEQADWEVVSAGAAHPPIQLAGRRRAASVGKLSLEDYAALLCESTVGVSLMASPHPSYPPLEMAHFGLLTLTNGFGPKDLSHAHDNIRTLPSARPEAIAEALAEACRAFEADPGAGPRGASRAPGYLDAGPYSFLDALAQDMIVALEAPS